MTNPRMWPISRRVDVPAPAAGANLSVRNDSGGTWLIRSLALRLVTDANVAVRSVALSATAGEDVWWRTVAQVTQAATLTRDYSGWAGAPVTAIDAVVILLPLPTDGLWLPPGNVLASVIANIQATDAISSVFLWVIEYPEGLPSHFVPYPPQYEFNDQER